MCTSEGEGGGVEYLVVVLGQLVQHPCVVGVEVGQLLHNYKEKTYCGGTEGCLPGIPARALTAAGATSMCCSGGTRAAAA